MQNNKLLLALGAQRLKMLSLHSPQALLHVGFTQGVPVIVAVNTGTPRRNSELRSGAVLTARVRKVLELGPLSPTEVQSCTLAHS